MTPEDKFTVKISMEITRETGEPDKKGVMSDMSIKYYNMDYGDVVAVESLVTSNLVPALLEAGYKSAEASGIAIPPMAGRPMNTKGR